LYLNNNNLGISFTTYQQCNLALVFGGNLNFTIKELEYEYYEVAAKQDLVCKRNFLAPIFNTREV
jgi:hypothetical protein